MDAIREKKMRQKLRAGHIQVREKNKAERRLLANHLAHISLTSRRVTNRLDHQLKVVERELQRQNVINEDNAAFEARHGPKLSSREGSHLDALKATRDRKLLIKSASAGKNSGCKH